MAKEPGGMVAMFSDEEAPPKAQDRPGAKIKFGYDFGEVASALQKEIRKGDEVAAVKWGLLLYDAAPYYSWKRLVICAAEDVGFGDPQAVLTVNAMYSAWRGMKEKSFHVSAHSFTFGVMLLCRAPKSTEVEDLQSSVYVGLFEDKTDLPEMPEYAVDCHTTRGKVLHPGLAGDQKFYVDRHRTFGMPTNQYTARLASFRPQWFEPIKSLLPKAMRRR